MSEKSVLSYKARRRWSLFILVVGLPVYIVVCATILSNMNLWQLHWAIELVIYVLMGVIWAFPLKFVFKGVGQADPDTETGR